MVLIWKPTEEETSLNGLAIKSYPIELKSIHSLASKSFDRQVGALKWRKRTITINKCDKQSQSIMSLFFTFITCRMDPILLFFLFFNHLWTFFVLTALAHQTRNSNEAINMILSTLSFYLFIISLS